MSTGKVISSHPAPWSTWVSSRSTAEHLQRAEGDAKEENKAAGKPAVRITLKVASHLRKNRVHGIAMSTTDGLTRGMDVTDTGAPIAVPVGQETLGRLINVLGEPVDEKGPIRQTNVPNPSSAPKLEDQDTKTESWGAGIKGRRFIGTLQ